ncbi:MAG: hypothetical protein IC227_01990 [Enterococcus lacertideformus]|uniref:Uncharacterized protein n=1 Tax=Enterococcus lacertideformus TaxID=2771493 RepID=A0A931AYY0_9ENTE|nr:hypothetical protein [Enterococcus lacertideformus]
MVTEEELRDLNSRVYRVDPNYKDNGNKIQYTYKADKYLSKNERNSITAGNQEFKVLSVKNGDYGFQGMASNDSLQIDLLMSLHNHFIVMC